MDCPRPRHLTGGYTNPMSKDWVRYVWEIEHIDIHREFELIQERWTAWMKLSISAHTFYNRFHGGFALAHPRSKEIPILNRPG